MADPWGFLMHFDDGPLADRHGVAQGTLNVDEGEWSWPLPNLLGVRVDGPIVVIWDAVSGRNRPDGATAQLFYAKRYESALGGGTAMVVRGAAYGLDGALGT